MCGRYYLQRDPAGLARYFDAGPPTPNHPPSWNIAPTQASLVLRRNPTTGARQLDVLRWGLVPHWAKDASGGARLINARAETVAEKPSFRDAFRQRRCIVPMDGFYEWMQGTDPKQPFAVALRGDVPMGVAGLWEGWKQPDGTWLRTYSVITCAAAGRQSLLHPRTPVILPASRWPAWLGEPAAGACDPGELLRPAEDALLNYWPVSPRVGKVSENDPGLLERTAMELRAEWSTLDDPPSLGTMDLS